MSAPYSRVTSRLYIGTEDFLWSPSVREGVMREGIDKVIDCRSQSEVDHLARQPDHVSPKNHFVYRHVPTEDNGRQKVRAFYSAILAGAAERSWQDTGATMVFCSAGVNRSPAAVHFLLRALYGMAASESRWLIASSRTAASDLYFPSADKAIELLYSR